MDLATALNQLPNLRTTVEAHGLMAKKALGQNFLLDANITDKIVRSSLAEQNLNDFSGCHVFEIGCGPGGLTRSVLRANPQQLTVIEMDERCIGIMQEIKEKVGERLQIVEGDALKYDIAALPCQPKHLISNLPYNISVPLLTKWLSEITAYQSLTLMFQKEVADRILAPTSCKDYGRLSVLAQLQCRITRLFDLNPNCFVPAPKIWSSVLLFQTLAQPLSVAQISKLEKLTDAAFAQRRKMIRQSLKNIPDLESKCAAVGIAPTYRPEQITPQQFLQLSEIA